MSTILCYLEQTEGKLSKGALVTIAAALKMKSVHGYSSLVGVLIGDAGIDEGAKSAAQYGLDEILFVRAPQLEHYLAQPYEAVILDVARAVAPSALVALASTQGKDLMPRIASALEAGQASDCIDILPDHRFRRPMFAGNIIADVEVLTATKVITIRGTAFDPAKPVGSSAPVKEHSLGAASASGMEFVSFETVKSERPELTEAEIVVSGGRAVKSKEGFDQFIIPLADALGAAVGASRAAVDSGYAPNDWQVGQTGKIVAPMLYIAIGISGAIQHLAGMKDSKVIVAINKDPDAPIFEIADYALIADLFEVVPQMTEAVKKLRG